MSVRNELLPQYKTLYVVVRRSNNTLTVSRMEHGCVRIYHIGYDVCRDSK